MDRIVVADDHPLFRAALRSAVDKAAPGAEVVECASLAEARAAMVAGPVDLLLLDLKLSDSEGMAGLAAVRAEQPTVPVAVVSASEDAPVVRHALEVTAAAGVRLTDSIRAFGSIGYDIENESIISRSFGVGYADECFSLIAQYQSTDDRYQLTSSESKLMVTLSLRTLVETDFNYGLGED